MVSVLEAIRTHSCSPNNGQTWHERATITQCGSWRVFDRRIEMSFSSNCSEVRRILGDENGQTLVFVALSMTLLLGFLGFATDVGTLFYAKRQIQTAADAAAIAGAAELNYGNMLTAARDAATQNRVTNGSGGSVVTATNPPVYGIYQGNWDTSKRSFRNRSRRSSWVYSAGVRLR